jgi:purine-binding chemotaxis protein CheW
MDLQDLLKDENLQEEELASMVKEEGEEDLLTDVDIMQLVSFILDDVEYGIDILSVHEIMRMPNIARLPNTPPFIKGVINLRGNVIPVVDVRERFGFPVAKITDLTRIIVIESMEKLVGLLVDNVHQVVRLPESNIDPPAELVEGVSEVFIKGIGRLNKRLIVILNLNNMLFEEE